MAKINQVYKCNVCGNIVEVVHPSVGTLVCCNQDMELLVAKTEDVGNEKHVPVLTIDPTGVLVKVGSVEHPMEEKHYIEWIEVIVDGKVQKKYLKPGDKPQAHFKIAGDKIIAREFCNIHGLWQSK